ncbi:riboflavin biosynthesis protein RibD, partial [Bifidobacterium adolescentis]
MAARRTAGRTCPFPDRSRRLRDVRHNVCGLDWCNMLGVMEDMLQYREYMAQALELARKGAGWVDPNPLVGAVVVRDGEVLATGYHDRYRGPHAERMAFD